MVMVTSPVVWLKSMAESIESETTRNGLAFLKCMIPQLTVTAALE